MKLSRRRQFMWGLVGLSLIISAILTFIFREQVRAGLVMPISYAVWYVNLIIESAPQPILWAILVFGGFIIAGRALLKNLPPPPEPPEPTYSGHSVSRYQYWLWYISSFQLSAFSSEGLARSLARFVTDILAYQEHVTLDEVERLIFAGALDVPDEIRELIKTRRLWKTQANPTPVRRFIDRLLRRKIVSEPDQKDSAENRAKLDRIVEFIEERLEIEHELTR